MNMKKGQKIPFALSAMIPWTAEFVAKVLNESSLHVDEMGVEKLEIGAPIESSQMPLYVSQEWTTEDVLRIARHNAAYLYGI
jgi:hypothetical protein